MKKSDSKLQASRKQVASVVDKWFNEIWAKYPRRLKRAVAFERFKKQIKTPEDFKNITMALVNYKADVEHERKNGHADLRWQHGGTWFYKSWLDYVDLKQPANGQPKPSNEDWKKAFTGETMPPEQVKKLIKDFNKKLK